jgi:hypothetical protein
MERSDRRDRSPSWSSDEQRGADALSAEILRRVTRPDRNVALVSAVTPNRRLKALLRA